MKIKYFSITNTKIIFIPFRAKWLVRTNSLHATSVYAQKSSKFPGTQNISNQTLSNNLSLLILLFKTTFLSSNCVI